MQKFEYKHLLPPDFNRDSRVWIYQSNRLFTISEALQIEDMLVSFAANWKSHGADVKAHANLLFGQFIILVADETATGVSGCSTDSSVRLIKEIEKTFHVDLFNRQLLAFLVEDKLQLLPFSQIPYAIKNDFITGETIYFNNLVETIADLEQNWMIPVKKAGLLRGLALTAEGNDSIAYDDKHLSIARPVLKCMIRGSTSMLHPELTSWLSAFSYQEEFMQLLFS